MSLLLEKRKSDLLDLSIGEPFIFRSLLNDCLPPDFEINFQDSWWEYLSPKGYDPLVKFLEEKHQNPIIITSGAKQALGAAFYALRKSGRNQCITPKPFWALLPDLADFHQVDFYSVPWEHAFPSERHGFLLLVSPNNPNGWMPDPFEYQLLIEELQDRKIPIVHDGAYYSPGYVKPGTPLLPIGDLQIFSFSKMLGVPGLRTGYIVCHNNDYYKDLLAYQEMTTVGVSEASQHFILQILQYFKELPEIWKWINDQNYQILLNNKKTLTSIDPSIMLLAPECLDHGMFAWATKGPNFDRTKELFLSTDGTYFGDSSKVRLNLSISSELLKEVINKL